MDWERVFGLSHLIGVVGYAFYGAWAARVTWQTDGLLSAITTILFAAAWLNSTGSLLEALAS